METATEKNSAIAQNTKRVKALRKLTESEGEVYSGQMVRVKKGNGEFVSALIDLVRDGYYESEYETFIGCLCGELGVSRAQAYRLQGQAETNLVIASQGNIPQVDLPTERDCRVLLKLLRKDKDSLCALWMEFLSLGEQERTSDILKTMVDKRMAELSGGLGSSRVKVVPIDDEFQVTFEDAWNIFRRLMEKNKRWAMKLFGERMKGLKESVAQKPVEQSVAPVGAKNGGNSLGIASVPAKLAARVSA